MQAVSSAQRPAAAVPHSRRLQPAAAACSPAASSQRLAAALPRRQLARQAASSWQRQRAARPVAAAAAPRDFDKDKFEAANKDYAKLTQQIEVRPGHRLWGREAAVSQAGAAGEQGPACVPSACLLGTACT